MELQFNLEQAKKENPRLKVCICYNQYIVLNMVLN